MALPAFAAHPFHNSVWPGVHPMQCTVHSHTHCYFFGRSNVPFTPIGHALSMERYLASDILQKILCRLFSQSLVALSWKFHVSQEASERANCCGHRNLMHFVCVSGKSVSDSIPGRAGVVDWNVVLGSVCKWDAPVELWEQFQIQNPPSTDVGQNQQD